MLPREKSQTGRQKIEYQIRKGHYSSINQVIGEINRAKNSLEKKNESIYLYHDGVRNITSLIIKEDGMKLEFSEDLAIIFGLD